MLIESSARMIPKHPCINKIYDDQSHTRLIVGFSLQGGWTLKEKASSSATCIRALAAQ
jgi:hypothetical protein